MRVRHIYSIKKEGKNQPGRCNMAEQSGKCTSKKAQETWKAENTSCKQMHHRNKKSAEDLAHKGDIGEIMLSFPRAGKGESSSTG